MKKVERISLGGIVFHIDEDAYYRLIHYLEMVERSYGSENSTVLEDYELRISELLHSKIMDKNISVNMKHVEEVISILGTPENSYKYDNHHYYTAEKPRKVFRNTRQGVMGGVCSGFGDYFGVDPVLLRVLFVASALVFGASIILYLLLWIFIPVHPAFKKR